MYSMSIYIMFRNGRFVKKHAKLKEIHFPPPLSNVWLKDQNTGSIGKIASQLFIGAMTFLSFKTRIEEHMGLFY